MAGRDFLASLMSKGDAPQVDAAAYNQMLLDNMARYHGNRDQAVMNTNIAGGYGNSTAQRFMHEAGPVPGGPGTLPDPMQTGAVPVPTPRPEDGGGGGVPIPTPRPGPPEPGIGSGIPMPEPGIGSGIPTPQLPGQATQSPTSQPNSPPDHLQALATALTAPRLQPIEQPVQQPRATAMTAPRQSYNPQIPLPISNGYPTQKPEQPKRDKVKGKEKGKAPTKRGRSQYSLPKLW